MHNSTLKLLLTWQISAVFLTMFFVAVLKTTLIQKSYEKQSTSLGHAIDKDMTLYTAQTNLDFFDKPAFENLTHYKRVSCQARKKNSAYDASK